MKTNQKQNNLQKEVESVYEKPVIEIIEMEMESGILLIASAGKKGDNFRPGGGGGAW